MSLFRHIVLTRFNVFIASWQQTKNGDAVHDTRWLTHRLRLFETYCLPSVCAQTEDNFDWYLFMDQNTPRVYRQRLEQLARDSGRFEVFFVTADSIWYHYASQIIRQRYYPQYRFVVTTRLDNDDIVHCEFIARIQQQFLAQANTVIDLRDGYQLSIEHPIAQLRQYTHPYNAFLSLIEDSAAIQTVFCKMHYDWRDCATRVVQGEALWIELVHEMNKLNILKPHLKKVATLDWQSFALSQPLPVQRRYSIVFYNIWLDIKLLIKQVPFLYRILASLHNKI